MIVVRCPRSAKTWVPWNSGSKCSKISTALWRESATFLKATFVRTACIALKRFLAVSLGLFSLSNFATALTQRDHASLQLQILAPTLAPLQIQSQCKVLLNQSFDIGCPIVGDRWKAEQNVHLPVNFREQ